MINTLLLLPLLLLLRRVRRLSSTAHIQQRTLNRDKMITRSVLLCSSDTVGGVGGRVPRFLRRQNTVGTAQIWSLSAWDVSVWLNRFKISVAPQRNAIGRFCACAIGTDEACLKKKGNDLDGDEYLTFKTKWKCRRRYYRSDPLWCPSSLTIRALKLQNSTTFFEDRRSCFAWTCTPHPFYIPHMEEKTWRNVANLEAWTQKYIIKLKIKKKHRNTSNGGNWGLPASAQLSPPTGCTK